MRNQCSYNQSKKIKSKKKADSLNGTYILRNKYLGKTRSHIQYIPKTFIIGIIIFPLLYLLELMPVYNIYYALFFDVTFIIGLFINRMKVSPEGIKFWNELFKWEEIKTIGISVTEKGLPHKFWRKMIYISKEQYDMPVHLSSSLKYQRHKASCGRVRTVLFRLVEPEHLFRASFNRRLIHHIIAYWGTDIRNLDDTIGWRSYVRFYNFIHRKRKGNMRIDEDKL